MSSHVPACVVQLAGLKLPPLAKTCFSELIEDQGFNDSHIIDVPSSGKRKKMPKKKSQDALAEAAGDSSSPLNGKKLVTQESEEKDSDQLVMSQSVLPMLYVLYTIYYYYILCTIYYTI